jgi:hypothetical protein
MSHIRETADLEAEIDALIKRAAASFRQPLDDVLAHASLSATKRKPGRRLEPANGRVADGGSTLGCEP